MICVRRESRNNNTTKHVGIIKRCGLVRNGSALSSVVKNHSFYMLNIVDLSLYAKRSVDLYSFNLSNILYSRWWRHLFGSYMNFGLCYSSSSEVIELYQYSFWLIDDWTKAMVLSILCRVSQRMTWHYQTPTILHRYHLF